MSWGRRYKALGFRDVNERRRPVRGLLNSVVRSFERSREQPTSSWNRLCVTFRETFDEVEGLSGKEQCPLEARSQAGDYLGLSPYPWLVEPH